MPDGRRRALAAVRDAGEDGAPVTDIAAATDVHPNMARRHLDRLVVDGLVRVEEHRTGGKGRPSRRYRLTGSGLGTLAAPRDQGAEEYLGLASAFAEHLAASEADPRPAAREVGRAWGARLAQGQDEGVVDLLERLGFSPEGRGEVLALRTCPLLDAARAHPEVVCEVHLGLVHGASAAYGGPREGGDLAPFAESGACLLRLPAVAEEVVGDG